MAKVIQYTINPKVFTKKVDDRIFILKEGEDFYREFNDTASLIWESIKNKKSIDSIVSLFMKTYVIDKNTAKKDIEHFIENYIKVGLLIKK